MGFHRVYEDKTKIRPDGIREFLESRNVRPVYDYNQQAVNEIVDSLGVNKVAMSGCYDDLKKLKDVFDDFLGTDDWFYLTYALDEVWYHWRQTPENVTKVKNMHKCFDGIKKHVLLAYAYILAGLGEKLPVERYQCVLPKDWEEKVR